MHIDGLGELVPDRWGHRSAPVPVPLFEGALLSFLVRDSAVEGAGETVRAFLRLSRADRQAASRWVHAHWTDACDSLRSRPGNILSFAQPILDLPIRAPEDMWSFARPTGASVERREADGLLYVSVVLDIDWDKEHGMQLVFRGGSDLSRVGDLDCELTTADAWSLPESQDRVYFSRADLLDRIRNRSRGD